MPSYARFSCPELGLEGKVLEREIKLQTRYVIVIEYKRSIWDLLKFVICHLKISTVTENLTINLYVNRLIPKSSKNV